MLKNRDKQRGWLYVCKLTLISFFDRYLKEKKIHLSAFQLKLKSLTNSSYDTILNQKVRPFFSVFFSYFLILQNRAWVYWTNSCYAYTIKIVNDGRYILLRKGYKHIVRTLFLIVYLAEENFLLFCEKHTLL